jgi:hypothetical protein
MVVASSMEVMHWCGGEVLTWLMHVWLAFFDTWFFDRLQICWDLQNSFMSLWWFSNLLRFAGFIVSSCVLFYVCVNYFEADCELRLICLGRHSTVVPSIFGLRSSFLDYNGPITFDSRSGVRV